MPLHDCILYLTHYLYDPGILPGSAIQYILGKLIQCVEGK